MRIQNTLCALGHLVYCDASKCSLLPSPHHNLRNVTIKGLLQINTWNVQRNSWELVRNFCVGYCARLLDSRKNLEMKMNWMVVLQHSDYSLASCTIYAREAEVHLQILQTSMCNQRIAECLTCLMKQKHITVTMPSPCLAWIVCSLQDYSPSFLVLRSCSLFISSHFPWVQ